MAKTSISLRLEPHESHIIREALRLYDYILDWQLSGGGAVEDFDWNFGTVENPHQVRVYINQILVEMGGKAPPASPAPLGPGPQKPQGFWDGVKEAYRKGYESKRIRRGLF